MRPGRIGVLLPVAVVVLVLSVVTTAAFARSSEPVIGVAIMTDCAGPFGPEFERSLAGAQAALAQYAHGRVRNRERPSAGVAGITVSGRRVRIVGYGCGDGTVGTAISEAKRLMGGLHADVMIGPATSDEATAIAQYAGTSPTKTFILGTGGSQDPTLQIAPRNLFRYHGDGAQRSAGLGELVYRRLGWRTAVIVIEDDSLGWTSAAGAVAGFCASGGEILRRVFVPPTASDYAPTIAQLLPPARTDGYFWVLRPTELTSSLKAFAKRYGGLDPRSHAIDVPLAIAADYEVVPRQLIGAYAGGLGTAPGLRTPQSKTYEAIIRSWYPKLGRDQAADPFVYDYFNAAWAFVQGLSAAGGRLSKLAASMPRAIRPGYEISSGGLIQLDRNRQAVEDAFPLRIVARTGGRIGVEVAAQVPNVSQSFGGLFTDASPPPGRTQPACSKRALPWLGRIREVQNGLVTGRRVSSR